MEHAIALSIADSNVHDDGREKEVWRTPDLSSDWGVQFSSCPHDANEVFVDREQFFWLIILHLKMFSALVYLPDITERARW